MFAKTIAFWNDIIYNVENFIANDVGAGLDQPERDGESRLPSTKHIKITFKIKEK